MGAIRDGLGCLSWVGAGVIVVLLVLKVVWFDVATMGHNGMAPTLLRGERVLIHKRGAPAMGTISVCKHPTEVGWVVGRVAATEGMTIESFGSELRIDGKPARFQRLGQMRFHNVDSDRTRPMTYGDELLGGREHWIFIEEDGRHLVDETRVPAGKLYLLGDFRSYMGQDSRAYGVVDASTCRGNIVFRLTPVEGLDDAIAHRYLQPIR